MLFLVLIFKTSFSEPASLMQILVKTIPKGFKYYLENSKYIIYLIILFIIATRVTLTVSRGFTRLSVVTLA